jgi:hypothetical protein
MSSFSSVKLVRDRTHKMLLYSYFKNINTQPVGLSRSQCFILPHYESLSILPPVSASAILWILSWLIEM